MNVADPKRHKATPRLTGSKKSASAPPTTASGADAKKPPKNLQMKIVWRFVATATGTWKMAKHR
jgi:hypothetical protein